MYEHLTTRECETALTREDDTVRGNASYALTLGNVDGGVTVEGSLDELDFFVLRVRALVQDARIAHLTDGAS